MKILVRFVATTLVILSGQAPAAEVTMRRVLSCVGPDAKIEVYVPQNAKLNKRGVGAYLDLTDAGKGKTLEPVHVQYSRDRKSVIVDQYTRKLPPTIVPIAGATVNFDQLSRPTLSAGPSIVNESQRATGRRRTIAAA
jgi:hypothetical protein